MVVFPNFYTWCDSSVSDKGVEVEDEDKPQCMQQHFQKTLPCKGKEGDNWRGQESWIFFVVSKIRESRARLSADLTGTVYGGEGGGGDVLNQWNWGLGVVVGHW